MCLLWCGQLALPGDAGGMDALLLTMERFEKVRRAVQMIGRLLTRSAMRRHVTY